MKENLLDTHQCDLALYVGENQHNNETELWQFAKYKWITDEFEDWGKVFEEIDETRTWDALFSLPKQFLGGIKCDKNCLEHCLNLTGKNCKEHPGSAGILLAFRYLISKKINEFSLVGQYEYFIFTRTDHLFLCEHPKWDDVNIAVVEGEGWGGYTDRHWVMKSKFALSWLNVTNFLVLDTLSFLNNVEHRSYNFERILYYYTKDYKKWNVTTISRVMASIREVGVDETRWSNGDAFESDKLDNKKYHVKYRKAMNQAKRNCGEKNTKIRKN